MGLRNWLTSRRNRGAARAVYFAAETWLIDIHATLANADSADDRAALLGRAHKWTSTQANIYPAAFGPDPLDDEDGQDMAESLTWTALLYRLLADVETAVAYPGRGRRWTDSPLERVAGDVLDSMAATPDLAARTRLLQDLAAEVEPVAGVQAVETLWTLPSPGYDGWMTISAKNDRLQAQGYGRPLYREGWPS